MLMCKMFVCSGLSVFSGVRYLLDQGCDYCSFLCLELRG